MALLYMLCKLYEATILCLKPTKDLHRFRDCAAVEKFRFRSRSRRSVLISPLFCRCVSNATEAFDTVATLYLSLTFDNQYSFQACQKNLGGFLLVEGWPFAGLII